MRATVEEVLQYRNDAVVDKFRCNWNCSREDATEIFREMLKWLWLGAHVRSEVAQPRFALAVTQEIRVIDEMWHTFVLFTADYQDFCDRHFGCFLHHLPDVPGTSPALPRADAEAQMRQQLEKIYDLLGEDTVRRWYAEYPEKYSDEVLQSLRLWARLDGQDATSPRAATCGGEVKRPDPGAHATMLVMGGAP